MRRCKDGWSWCLIRSAGTSRAAAWSIPSVGCAWWESRRACCGRAAGGWDDSHGAQPVGLLVSGGKAGVGGDDVALNVAGATVKHAAQRIANELFDTPF